MKLTPWLLLAVLSSACTTPPRPTAVRSGFVAGSTFFEAHWRPSARPAPDGAQPGGEWQLQARPSPLVAARQVALGEDNHLAWATLISQIHTRVHPLFAVEYLRSLEGVPRSHALANRELTVEIELHLLPSSGAIHRIGIRRSSGVRAFDVAALTAFRSALPVPFSQGLASEDGYAYLLWELHRDPTVACSTLNALPIRIAASEDR